MSDPARYVVPRALHRAEQTIDRNRFICTVDRLSLPADAQQFLREMNDEFPDATHNCWAYLIGAPGSTDRIGMSDAGEPHGTAGRPMLSVLQHSGVGDIAARASRRCNRCRGRFESTSENEEYGERATFRLRVPVSRVEAMRAALLDATSGRAELAPSDPSARRSRR